MSQKAAFVGSLTGLCLSVLAAVGHTQAEGGVPLAITEMRDRFGAYCDRGQRDDERATLVDVLQRRQAELRDDPAFLLAERHYLSLLDDLSQAVWKRLPDTALTAPADIVERLGEEYVRAPESALPLARRLAAMHDDRAARAAFVNWVHNVVALDFVPRMSPRGSDGGAALLVRALADGSDSFSTAVTAALSTWLEAVQTDGPTPLQPLMKREYSEPEAYGPRYQLLMYDRMERAQATEIAINESRVARNQLVERLRPLERARQSSIGLERLRLDYWLAFAYARQADIARRGSGSRREEQQYRLSLSEASQYSTDFGSRPRDAHWYQEAQALGGRQEFITPEAEVLESSGYPDQALKRWTAAARADREFVPQLEIAYRRVHPTGSFDEYWREERFRYSTTLSELRTASGSGRQSLVWPRKDWTVITSWTSECAGAPASISALGELARDFPGSGMLASSADESARLTAHVTAHGVALPTAIVREDQEALVTCPPTTLLVRPDGRYLTFVGDAWRPEARFWLERAHAQP